MTKALRILAISPHLPWPLHGGNMVRIYNILRELGPDGNVLRSVEEWVEINPQFLRTGEIHDLRADARLARSELGWQPAVDFQKLVRMMLESDLASARGE